MHLNKSVSSEKLLQFCTLNKSTVCIISHQATAELYLSHLLATHKQQKPCWSITPASAIPKSTQLLQLPTHLDRDNATLTIVMHEDP